VRKVGSKGDEREGKRRGGEPKRDKSGKGCVGDW